MSAHAKLSPSGGEKWMTCPGAIHLEATMPEMDSSSPHAARGTAIHELSEKCLEGDKLPASYIGQTIYGLTIDEDMAAISDVYVNYVREAVGLKLYEKRVSLEHLIPDCFGTVDCVVMRPGHLIIIDLKAGSGVQVTAEDNKQLQIYALGALQEFDWVYDFEKVTLVIVQPPLENISVSSLTVDELRLFGEQLKVAYQAIINEPNKYVMSEKGCRWCKAKPVCPEQKRLAAEMAAKDFASMTAQDISESLELIPLVKQFIASVEGFAKDSLITGKAIPGWKVVEGRRSRGWKSEDQVINFFLENGLDHQVFSTPELLSVAQVEKKLKGVDIDFKQLIETKSGQPTLAKDDDKREAINNGNRAAKDFANV